MRINVGYFWAKFLKYCNRPALRNCNIDRRAHAGSGAAFIDVSMGKYSYTGSNNAIMYTDIGSYCSIASYCAIGGAGHELDAVSTSPVFYQGHNALGKNFSTNELRPAKRVIIGNDVWIGEGCFILEGITIGDGAVIGAHSVVTHDVKPYEIVAGSPARVLRKRFSDEIIDSLLKIAWWNWDDEKISKYAAYFTDPEKLINALKRDNE